MEKLEEPKIQQNTPSKAEKLIDPKKDEIKVVSVEELIPDIEKQETLGSKLNHSGSPLSDSFIQNFLERQARPLLEEKRSPFRKDGKRPIDLLREKLKNQVVVELGAGAYGLGYFLSQIWGSKGYVGVDKFYAENLEKNLQRVNKKTIARLSDIFSKTPSNSDVGALVPASIVADDMLSFLKRLPNNSVSVFAFGIDSHVITDENYRNAVGREIQRVLSDKGLYLQFDSEIKVKGLKNFGDELKKKGREVDGGSGARMMFGTKGIFLVK